MPISLSKIAVNRPFWGIGYFLSWSFQNRKIPIINPGLIFVQKAFLLGLFTEGLIIGRNFAFQNGLGLTIKTT